MVILIRTLTFSTRCFPDSGPRDRADFVVSFLNHGTWLLQASHNDDDALPTYVPPISTAPADLEWLVIPISSVLAGAVLPRRIEGASEALASGNTDFCKYLGERHVEC